MLLLTREAILADADARIAKCRREIDRRIGYASQRRTVACLRVELHRRTWRERQPGIVVEPEGALADRTYCRRCRCHTVAHVTQSANGLKAGCVYCGHRLNDQLVMEHEARQPKQGWA